MIRNATIAVVALLSACSGSSSGKGSSPPVALVAVEQARKEAITQSVTLYGVVELSPAGQHVVPAPTEAVVVSIDTPVGTRVRPGQIIGQLRGSPATQVDLSRATADALAADQAYARAQRLRSDGLIGNSEVETARAAALSADATRDSLLRRVGSLSLRAPAAGYVATVAVRPGDIIAAGSVVATIDELGEVRARFGLDSALAQRVDPGASLLISRSAGGDPISSQILSVSPVVDPQTKLASIFASIPTNADLSAGVPLTGSLALISAANTPTIPYTALLDDAGQPFVFVVVDGVAHRRDVAIGATGRDRVAIAHGLVAGDQVITQGGTAVEDGMRVRMQ
jgi:RND family efflux transporter MFP subunit